MADTLYQLFEIVVYVIVVVVIVMFLRDLFINGG